MTGTTDQTAVRCRVCGQLKKPAELLPASVVRSPVSDLIRREHHDWNGDGFICIADLNYFRIKYASESLEEERGELSSLEMEVLQGIAEHKLLAENVNVQFEQNRTFSQRLADNLASVGGSWSFITMFAILVAAWMIFNLPIFGPVVFDEYPYGFLKTVLGILAAVQAPIIMMSQKRQQAKDRLRSEHDYLVSLKAEMEIRHLNAKIDLLLTRWWHRLGQIQTMQLELMEEMRLGPRKNGRAVETP